jgi:RNA polymerase sigma-70 factor (ECF subfamily)
MLFASDRRRRAFEEEALPHLPSLYAVALRLTRNERDAEDLVQDAMVRGLRFFHRFEPGTNCKAWLFKILHNTFVNRYRRRSREREVAGSIEAADGVGPVLSQEALDAARDPERAILDGILSDDVQRALAALPDEFRMAVLLCDLEELSYREIADVMDCPVGTVMSRLHRGRRLLQAALRSYAGERGIGDAAQLPVTEVIPFPRGGAGGGER